ncbi:serine/threonine protein kinase [Melittangium boletus]|uniref:Protein kinase domain-containing protein n=1 Tax=Melittangium boletus DSM 14713 TaxID=1294270 RepID=A0A250IH21_9BACT|nr:serine/threonine-protein kinase [Melittangium boletus]ATB30226.1 hypothetical protein MEBOL_003686 [Melittangium boletus DSM 14713]
MTQQVGKYQLVRKLATGGMAEVFLAKAAGPMGFEKTLVLKRILPHLAEEPTFVQMFLSEAKLAARLTHPHIVQIFDFGESEGAYFLAMEYVDGPSLRTLIKRAQAQGTSLPPTLCARLVSHSCEGLAFAHDFVDPDTGEREGLIHRDISPDNILLSRQGAVKVVDFGIAKAASQGHRTQSGVIKGKLAYMPPEQLRARDMDRRVDVYALGVVLYELLTGQRPYSSDSDAGLMQAILFESPVPAASIRPDLPESLLRILDKALAKDVSQRYPDCHAFQAELEEYIVSVGKPVTTQLVAQFINQTTSSTELPALRGPGAPNTEFPELRTTPLPTIATISTPPPATPPPVEPPFLTKKRSASSTTNEVLTANLRSPLPARDEEPRTLVTPPYQVLASLPSSASTPPTRPAPPSRPSTPAASVPTAQMRLTPPPVAPEPPPPALQTTQMRVTPPPRPGPRPTPPPLTLMPAVSPAPPAASAPTRYVEPEEQRPTVSTPTVLPAPPGPSASAPIARRPVMSAAAKPRPTKRWPSLLGSSLLLLSGGAVYWKLNSQPEVPAPPRGTAGSPPAMAVAEKPTPPAPVPAVSNPAPDTATPSPDAGPSARPEEAAQEMALVPAPDAEKTEKKDEQDAGTEVAAAPAVEAPEPEPVEQEKPNSPRQQQQAPAKPKRTAPPPKYVLKGTLELRIRPYATVFVDGRRLGDTPMAPQELPVGRHVVKLVNTDLSKTLTREVDIKVGQTFQLKENLFED